MSLQDHPKAYGAAALTVAFATGVLVTLGLKDVYPDLERLYEDRRKQNQLRRAIRRADTIASREEARRRGDSVGVRLEDHESEVEPEGEGEGEDGWSLLDESRLLDSRLLSRTRPAAGHSRSHGIAAGLADCIGDTPLVRIGSLCAATGCEVLAKAELLNPGGSPKDRVALSMIRTAEADGLLVPGRGDTIYEGTSGSTGISIATLARALGYGAHIFMPDDQGVEKSRLLREMGAVVERVPVAPIVDPGHFVNRARRAAAEHSQTHTDGSHGFFSDQFETPANAEAHRRTTGPEIVQQVASRNGSSRQSAFVCGAGTAGTLTGVARFLKEDAGLGDWRIVAADPQGSGLVNLVRNGVLYAATEKEGTRRRSQVDSIVEGIGMNRMTATLEAGLHLIDDAVAVSDTQACHMARWLVEHDGIFAGSSTAVNCVAAVAVALTLPPGSRVVTLLCDSGQRHLSKFYNVIDEMREAEGEGTEKAAGKDLLTILGLAPRSQK
ncbi:cysteine synthase 2 [Grosmannia clavigera kw1407]|uniref:Cysteine synthase 2 n=1 Tax=Grosmannia clavigera (strain kw1407 / UAMH 11150) TaxID=655863 RepID=F0XN23_GROCL|nr:cysteine synthase 2 [Grosmannia clavigera kw1407]EFX00851.1 cysteine synthase 2 [Grosmannia clavigera kw1407]